MKWIKSFKNISKEDTIIAGGKGASLGEMTQAGIPVPEGYVITSETFDRFLEITDINVEIDAILNDVDTEAIHTAEKASEEIQRLILAHEIPGDIKKEIQESFKELNTEFVAVRSSATAEDSASAAWAGQLDTFLNTTEITLLQNVKECWASLFTPRAIFYRFEQKLDKEAISVAVVVQKMVNSEVSGIAFSVHPVTEDRNQIIIEAGLGLGEAIVSGQITPDSYVTTKEQREILDKNVIIQERGMFRKEGGGNEWRDISIKEGEKQVLSDEQIQELTEIIINIENHYGFPVDIEWAVEDNKFYIVQSRPITTLSDKQTSEEKEQLELYKQEAKIGFYQVFLPFLTITARMQKYFKNSYGRVWLYSYRGNFTSLLVKNNMKTVSKEIFEKAADGSFYEIWNKWKNIEEELFNLSKKIKELDLEKLSNQELWEQYKVVYEKDLEMWEISIFIDALDIGLDQEEIDRIALENHFSPDEVHTLLTPVVSSYITIVENDLVYVRDGKMKAIEFADKYFWYGTDYSVCRGVTEEYVNELAQEAQFTELEDVVEQQEKILDKYELSENPLRLFQVLAQWRDDRKRANYIGLYGCCSLISEGMKRKGIKTSLLNNLFVSEIQDVFLGEINSEKLEKRFNTPVLSEIKEDGSWSFIEGDEAAQEFERLSTFLPSTNVAEIEGTTASPGIVRGIVRVVSHFSSESSKLMKEGDILVTSMTRPEFVPLMRIAGGIVTNEGGISCHAAIVSRELKKPCIIGTKIATQVLKDGDLVEVDADNGVVKILEK